MNTRKYVGYSYPTSPNAEELGFGRNGCYSVHVVTNGKDEVVAGFASKAAAIKEARMLKGEWDAAFLRYHGDWLEADTSAYPL